MFRAPFSIYNTYNISLFIICKIPPLYCKKKTQPLAFHQTKGKFLTKKGPFFINCDAEPKGIHNFFT